MAMTSTAFGAVYNAPDAVAFKALKLAPGDTVNMGAMGGFYAKGLTGVTLKGGTYTSVRLDDFTDVTLDGMRVVMPVTDATARYTPAVLLNRPNRVTIRNFDISASKRDGARMGYGLRIDSRGGRGSTGNVIENGLIHDMSTGIATNTQNNFTVRNVRVENISSDGMLIGSGKDFLIQDFTCGSFAELNPGMHPDCIQVDQYSGALINLTVRRMSMWNGMNASQGFFAGQPKGVRHQNWLIEGTRVYGITYRALSVMGVDGLAIRDSILLTPPQAKHFSMLTVDDSSNVVMRNNAACSHARNKVRNLDETGQITLGCKPGDANKGLGKKDNPLRGQIEKMRAGAN